jgi:hypothetical protein
LQNNGGQTGKSHRGRKIGKAKVRGFRSGPGAMFNSTRLIQKRPNIANGSIALSPKSLEFFGAPLVAGGTAFQPVSFQSVSTLRKTCLILPGCAPESSLLCVNGTDRWITGIQDIHNLAWKIAFVLNGGADVSIPFCR